MTTLSTINPTLADVIARTAPDGNIAQLVEMLSEQNGILDYMTFMEGNLLTGHKHSIRTGLPTVTWRKLYGGVQPSKSRSASVTDSCGMLEAYAEVDAALAQLNGNSAAWRLSEEAAFIQAMNKEVASSLIYANEKTSAEEITGLAPRYNSLSAENGDNIINAAGAQADNTSIWLVEFGPNSVFGIYPKGSQGGLQMTDKGQVTVENADGSNGRMEALRTHYRWDLGLTVRDWRCNARICNIDVGDLGTIANTKNLLTWMVQASERVESSGGRKVWLVNRTIREKLRLGILEKIANNLSWDSVEGKRVMTFDDIPVVRTDAILNTEAVVS